MTDLQAGSKIGDYTLESYLGGGSFGAVWKASSPSGEMVAVKLLTGALSSADSSRRRAEVEMLAAAAVGSRSEHVVKVLGSGDEPTPYIVMEYIEGGDLSSMLKDGGVLPAGRVIDVGIAIMDALSALTEAGIYHRDIKPANVMIDSKGVIKLADFGIAKIVGYESITMTGQAAMTMAYAAPEVWDEDGSFGRPSHRSDLYAAGIVLYQCLVGETPFKGNYGALYKAHAENTPNLATLPASTPPSLRMLIERCLEKRQTDRPVDANECLTMLRRAGVEVRERAGDGAKGEPTRFGPWAKQAPHPTQPWAWTARNETSGETAIVELHFVDKLDQGAELRRVVDANARLVGVGAERLLGTSRALLGPGEAWQAPPGGQFQFWVAREDKAPAAARTLGVDQTKIAVRNINALMRGFDREGIGVSLRDLLTVAQDGRIYLSRPGLVKADEYTALRAYTTLRSLPLNPEARELVESARDFESLVRIVGDDEDNMTYIVPAGGVAAAAVATPPPVEDQTVVFDGTGVPPMPPASVASGLVSQPVTPPPPPAQASGYVQQAAASVARPELAAPIQMHLRPRDAKAAPGRYELVLSNPGAAPAALRLSASSWNSLLNVDLPETVNVAGGSTQGVSVSISPRKKRMFGGKRRTAFTILASDDGGNSGRPPVSFDGEFEDDSSRAPLFAGGGVLGLAAAAALGAMLLSNGGGKASPNLAADTTPTPAATATVAAATVTATATIVPATETPVPPPPPDTPVPAPAYVAPAPAAPTSTPRPVVVQPTAVPVAPVQPQPVQPVAPAPAPYVAPAPAAPAPVPTATPLPAPTAVPTCPEDQAISVGISGPNVGNIKGACNPAPVSRQGAN